MATVWVARLQRKHGFEKLVAIKTILARYAEDETFQKMFFDEARIASRIDHVNVCHIHDLGEEDNILYLVMEWIDGDALTRLRRAVMKNGAAFPVEIALKILSDACAGLHAAHELRGSDGMPLGVVHRDVSPQNILINTEGVTKVIDFGVAKAADRLVEETNAGFVKGKLQYMAPEQALGKNIDRRADIYAVGAVLYHLLAGRAPYEADNHLALLHVITSGQSPAPLPPHVPPQIAEIIYCALHPDPDGRFASAADMRAAIESTGMVASHDMVAEFARMHLGEQQEKRKLALAVALQSTGTISGVIQPTSTGSSSGTGSAPFTSTPISQIAQHSQPGWPQQSWSQPGSDPRFEMTPSGPHLPPVAPSSSQMLPAYGYPPQYGSSPSMMGQTPSMMGQTPSMMGHDPITGGSLGVASITSSVGAPPRSSGRGVFVLAAVCMMFLALGGAIALVRNRIASQPNPALATTAPQTTSTALPTAPQTSPPPPPVFTPPTQVATTPAPPPTPTAPLANIEPPASATPASTGKPVPPAPATTAKPPAPAPAPKPAPAPTQKKKRVDDGF